MFRDNNNFDRSFNRMGNLIKIGFVVVGLMIVGSLAFRGCLVYDNFTSGKPVYEIKIPDYNGGYTTYLTTDYTEENGCIKFVDEYKFQQEICDKYTVTRWK